MEDKEEKEGKRRGRGQRLFVLDEFYRNSFEAYRLIYRDFYNNYTCSIITVHNLDEIMLLFYV